MYFCKSCNFLTLSLQPARSILLPCLARAANVWNALAGGHDCPACFGGTSMFESESSPAIMDRPELRELTEVFHDEPIDVKVLNYAHDKLRQGQVADALRELFPVLRARRVKSSDPEWSEYVEVCLRHPVRELLHQDPFTARAFNKPRGYAGDA